VLNSTKTTKLCSSIKTEQKTGKSTVPVPSADDHFTVNIAPVRLWMTLVSFQMWP